MGHYDEQRDILPKVESGKPWPGPRPAFFIDPMDKKEKSCLKGLLDRMHTEHEHYKKGTIQSAEFIAANRLNFFMGCVVKYAARHLHSKTGKEDLFDAINYLMMEIAHTYGETPDDIIRIISGKLSR